MKIKFGINVCNFIMKKCELLVKNGKTSLLILYNNQIQIYGKQKEEFGSQHQILVGYKVNKIKQVENY